MEKYHTAGRLVIRRPCRVVSGENFLSVMLGSLALYVQGQRNVIVKTVFVLMLLFDVRKVCRTKIFTKKYFLLALVITGH